MKSSFNTLTYTLVVYISNIYLFMRAIIVKEGVVSIMDYFNRCFCISAT